MERRAKFRPTTLGKGIPAHILEVERPTWMPVKSILTPSIGKRTTLIGSLTGTLCEPYKNLPLKRLRMGTRNTHRPQCRSKSDPGLLETLATPPASFNGLAAKLITPRVPSRWRCILSLSRTTHLPKLTIGSRRQEMKILCRSLLVLDLVE